MTPTSQIYLFRNSQFVLLIPSYFQFNGLTTGENLNIGGT